MKMRCALQWTNRTHSSNNCRPNDLCIGNKIGQENFGKVSKDVFRKISTIDDGVEVAIKIPGKLNRTICYTKNVGSELLQFFCVGSALALTNTKLYLLFLETI